MRLVLPYLGPISLQTWTKLQKSIKGVLNFCKLQVIFKTQNKLCNNFCVIDLFPKFLHQVWFTSFSVDYAMSPITENVLDRHLAVRSGEHIGISPLTNRKVQPRKVSAVSHDLLNCNYAATFKDFSVLCHENKKYLLEMKESLLIMRERPSGQFHMRRPK